MAGLVAVCVITKSNLFQSWVFYICSKWKHNQIIQGSGWCWELGNGGSLAFSRALCVCVSIGLPVVAPIWLLCDSPKSSLYPQDFHSHWTACCDWQSLFNGDKCDCWALPLPNHLQHTPVKEAIQNGCVCVVVYRFLFIYFCLPLVTPFLWPLSRNPPTWNDPCLSAS